MKQLQLQFKNPREAQPLPSQWQLLEQFHLNPQTGDLYFTDLAPLTKHSIGRGARNYNFAPITTISSKGCKVLNIKSFPYLQHRIIFKMMTGSEPHQVDHINGDPTDNRPCNLREATQSQNQHNRKMNKNNRSGYKNVHWHNASKKWRIEIRSNKKIVVSVLTDDLELAELVAIEGRDKYHGQYARHQ
jgi:hypothetical protein